MLKTKLSTFKSAMKAPQYQKLTEQELKIYQSGFRNGFKLAHSEFYERTQQLKLIIKHLKKRQPIIVPTGNTRSTATSDDIESVIKWVSKKYKTKREDIIGRSRLADITKLRSLVLNIVYEKYDLSTPAIGRYFGMDHTSILHHIKNKMNYKGCWSPTSNLWRDYKEFTSS